MGFSLDRTWGGVGAKGGGHLFVLGCDTFEGAAFRLDAMPQNSLTEVNVTSLRAGPGLGGGIGVSLFFAFNVFGLYQVNDMYTGRDWGVNVSIPGEKLGVGSASFKILKGLTTGAQLLKDFNVTRLAALRELASIFYSILFDVGAGVNLNDPKVIVIDVPEAGWAAELSAFLSWGQVTVGGRVIG